MSVKVTATSATGSVSVSATLDGQPFALPGTIDPFLLLPGDHSFRVVAVDQYGRQSAQTVTFSVHATIEGLICAVQRATAQGLIAPELENSLLVKLDAALSSRNRGNPTPEINQLQAFTQELAAQRGKKIDPGFDTRATAWTNDLISRTSAPKASIKAVTVARVVKHHKKARMRIKPKRVTRPRFTG